MKARIKAFLLIILVGLLGACGLRVPQIGEIWDDESGTRSLPLEKKIKEKIFCELNAAVAELNSKGENGIPVVVRDPKHPSRTIDVSGKAVPESWGATLTLTLTVEEYSGFGPGVALNTPMVPGATLFPGGITVPAQQAYSLGFGGTLSSTATRYDKYTFFYKIRDLEKYYPTCAEPNALDGNAPANYRGSSLLLESNLGIKSWLSRTKELRGSIGATETDPQQAYTYDVKFDIVSSGRITPTWTLVRVTTPVGDTPLFATKRERTHEMLLTVGPLSESKNDPGKLPSNDALASQIGSAVGNAVKRALAQ